MFALRNDFNARRWLALLALVGGLATGPTPSLWADGPGDNSFENVRRIPKPGIAVPEAVAEELQSRLETLKQKLDKLEHQALHGQADSRRRSVNLADRYFPDVLIFHRAVDQALRYNEFFDPKEFDAARKLLTIGHERADQLLAGEAPWVDATGLVVRGYRSKIDRTVQPYGAVIPENYDPVGTQRHRCDLWFHGRGETLSELNFIAQRLTSKGEFTPAGTLVLHPYGRYCNANKFAGEVDTFEVLEHAMKNYRIDSRRIAVRGFSMGGAACWQFAVHYPGLWFAANPGAGFSETPEFLKVFQNETLQPTWYEQKLWRWYDCTGYAANLAFLPTVAYSGDMDKQKQAADIMEQALRGEKLPLLHIIGPMTGHKIHPDSKVEIEKYLSRWDRLGPPQALKSPLPLDGAWETIEQFVTYTLRYHRSRWITVDAMGEHWEPARVKIERNTQVDPPALRITTENVWAFTLDCRMDDTVELFTVTIDGQPVACRDAFDEADEALRIGIGRNPQPESFRKVQVPVTEGSVPGPAKWVWTVAESARSSSAQGLVKKHGLQGPIDDAFLDSFIFVKPTSTGLSPAVDAWVKSEFERAVTQWRQQMRGDARVKLDTEITKADMQEANVVFWGDPKSNDALTQLYGELPVTWDLARNLVLAVGQEPHRAYDATTHIPVLIYPNPLNPRRYLVLNSSFTYREYDYLNNARQTPKLPDWAVIDVRVPPNARFPGKVVAADFFNEHWELKALRD